MPIKKKLHGVCFGLGDEEDRNEKRQKRGMQVVAKHFEWVRLYDPENYSEHLHQIGLKIAPTAWIGSDKTANFNAVDRLIAAAKRGLVDLAVVGNEMLFRKDCSPEHLINCIRRFKDAVPHIPVTCGEVEEFLIKYPQVMHACDVVGMHHYPSWCGIPVEKAVADFDRRYKEVALHALGKEIQVLEVGWPSDGFPKEGVNRGEAIASPESATRFFREFSAWAHGRNVKFFWFEAFDEAWKERDEGTLGSHWGMWEKPGGKRKYK